MKTFLRSLLAVLTGLAAALACVIAVEYFSSIVHPFPANFDGNVPEHVKRYPGWVLGIVVPAWGATFTAGTWVAARMGNRVTGSLVALLLAGALLLNLSLLPYALWFKAAMLAVFPAASLLGLTLARPRSAAA